jgi:hypothetical protein
MDCADLLLRATAMFTLSAGTCHAGLIAYQNALPNTSNGGITYVNNAAGANEANVAWQSASDFGTGNWILAGDDFSLSTSANISQVTVYEISNGTAPSTGAASSADAPQNEFQSITLFYGTDSAGLTNSTSDYDSQQIFYEPGEQNFEDLGGTYHAVYALSFNVNWNLTSGVLYGFGVDAVPAGITGNQLFLAASNVPLSLASGAIEDGTANEFAYWAETGEQGSSIPQFAGYCDASCQSASGFSGSDINVTLATTTPEPGTCALFGLGLALCAFSRRKAIYHG